jgi:hypothetical protein
MKILIGLCLILGFEYAHANYCSYNVYGERQFCMSDREGCLSESRRRGIKKGSDLCRKEEQLDSQYSKPADAKKGTCLWMESTSKKWEIFACYQTQKLCKSRKEKIRRKQR